MYIVIWMRNGTQIYRELDSIVDANKHARDLIISGVTEQAIVCKKKFTFRRDFKVTEEISAASNAIETQEKEG